MGKWPEMFRQVEGQCHVQWVGHFSSRLERKIWKERKRKNAKVTQRFLQLGSLANGAHIGIKGKSEPGLLWRERLSYFKTELKLLIFSSRKIDYTILFYINFNIFFNKKLDSGVQLETLKNDLLKMTGPRSTLNYTAVSLRKLNHEETRMNILD